ncbi:MAG: hypothetical protein ACJ746_08590 [Bryobacteraceae bacterium]
MSASNPKITITSTGSTNTVGMEVTLDGGEDASIRPQSKAARQVKLKSSAVAEFTKAVDAAGPLHALPANHCMKSASFGSNLFVSRGDDRSPDLSCPVQSDPRTAAIKKQAESLLQAAQKAGGVHTSRRIVE